MVLKDILKKQLSKSEFYLALYASLFSFLTYFCMYAFRKPFSVGVFEGRVDLFLSGIDYKILFIISQVIGYTLSKFFGIKIVSEARAGNRANLIIKLIVGAELALLGFALVPNPFKFLFLFLNGIPLGMIWGLVFEYLEGRRLSNFLGATLSTSFIVSSGAVKSVGRMLLNHGVSEFWMPFLTGLLFLPLLYVSVKLLDFIPPPSTEEQRLRTSRVPMTHVERRRFVKLYLPGLVALTFLYMLLTAYRDFRDNFSREIWDVLGFGANPEIFTLTEVPIAIGVLIVLSLLVYIRNTRRAFFSVLYIMISGTLMIGISTYLFSMGYISPVFWMIFNGLGLYLAYVPFGCILYDNLIAYLGFAGTAGFMICVSDAFGYVGSVALMMYKNFGSPNLSWLDFFVNVSILISVICTGCYLYGVYYFKQRTGALSELEHPMRVSNQPSPLEQLNL